MADSLFDLRLDNIIKKNEEKEINTIKLKLKLIPINFPVDKEGLDALTIDEILQWRKENGFPILDERWLMN